MTPAMHALPVSLTPAKHRNNRMSSRIFKKNRNRYKACLRGPGEVWRKKPEVKISWHCPLRQPLKVGPTPSGGQLDHSDRNLVPAKHIPSQLLGFFEGGTAAHPRPLLHDVDDLPVTARPPLERRRQILQNCNMLPDSRQCDFCTFLFLTAPTA